MHCNGIGNYEPLQIYTGQKVSGSRIPLWRVSGGGFLCSNDSCACSFVEPQNCSSRHQTRKHHPRKWGEYALQSLWCTELSYTLGWIRNRNLGWGLSNKNNWWHSRLPIARGVQGLQEAYALGQLQCVQERRLLTGFGAIVLRHNLITWEACTKIKKKLN